MQRVDSPPIRMRSGDDGLKYSHLPMRGDASLTAACRLSTTLPPAPSISKYCRIPQAEILAEGTEYIQPYQQTTQELSIDELHGSLEATT